MELLFHVTKQKISRKDETVVVSNSVKYLKAKFDFEADWNVSNNICPVFRKGGEFNGYLPEFVNGKFLDEQKSCYVPIEVLNTEGRFFVSIFDFTNGQRITTNEVEVEVTRSGPVLNSPTIYSLDLRLEDKYLQLTANGEEVGNGVTLPKQEIDTEMSETSVNPVQNKVAKAYTDEKTKATPTDIALKNNLLQLTANGESVGEGLEVSSLFGNHKRTIVNCPAFTNQPTVEGDLKEEFKPWNETYYFVHILDRTAGTFQLMALKNDTSTVIDQTFTLADLNTGNSGTLKENSPVDFISVGTDWKMRSAGVAVISFNLSKATNVDLKLSGYSNISGYFHIDSLNGFNTLDYMYSGSLSKIYLGNSGFLFSNKNIVGKNVFVSMNAKINVGQKTMNVCGSCSAQQMKDEDMYANQSDKTVLPIDGTCWRKGNADFETAYISGFKIRIDGILRNGFEIKVTGGE